MGEDFLTADFWGPAHRPLRTHFGENFTVLAVTGAAGDQCPTISSAGAGANPACAGSKPCANLARRLVLGVVADLTAEGEPDPKSWNGGTLLHARRLLERHADTGSSPTYPVDCNFLRIGNFTVATNPFELYLEYGQRIKARSLATQTIAAQLTNDGLAHLPTREGLAYGHYSAMPSNIRLGPEGGDQLVEQSLAHLNTLFGD